MPAITPPMLFASLKARAALLAIASLLAVLFLQTAAARADSSTTLTVVGTSDVSDSGLMQNVIQPAFAKAYPQFTFKYIGTATGTAIADAESGSVGASVLLVHAASLENQFVAGGYSQEQYGRALWTNDFVLGGPKSDPAGVAANAAHNIAQAFADIAAAGINGKATFVSRGGTPGTTVQEHQIWALMSSSGLAPSGLLLCTVNSTSGGGETPIAAGNGVTSSGQSCPNNGALPTSTELPSWYIATGLTQGPNVQNANACNGYPSGPNTCYAFTDRGTYDYLASGTDAGATIPNLMIVTRDDSASAPGGADELINYFHGYIINPNRSNETVNLTAAQDFLNFITSPSLQAQLKTYLASSDPLGPPFVADASPIIAVTRAIPRTYHAGKKVVITGALTNAEPGYPALVGKTVAIDEIIGGISVPVDTAKTDSQGAFTIKFTPPSTGAYEITTSQIAQVENSTLSPVFGDLLSPAASSPVNVRVYSAITSMHATGAGGKAIVVGSVGPGSGHVDGVVSVWARKAGSKGAYKKVASDHLAANDANFAIAAALGAASWQVQLTFKDGKRVVASKSRPVNVSVGAASSSVRLRSLVVKRGSVTVTGSSAPAGSGTVELVALRTSGAAAHLSVIARKASTGGTFAIHTRLKRGFRWVLGLEYISAGHSPSFSKLRATNVR